MLTMGSRRAANVVSNNNNNTMSTTLGGKSSPCSSSGQSNPSPQHSRFGSSAGVPSTYSPQQDASTSRTPVSKTFNVAVIGLSGTEATRGPVGVGKSCLCNRFVRPRYDDYYADHASTLSQADFSGSPVINSDHWLYWGERDVTIGNADSDSALHWRFRVVEQTEFVDDESFQPLVASGPSAGLGYTKRCCAAKLTSADKLMYLCKGQLGFENEYDQRLMAAPEEGTFKVDGYLCVYDASPAPGRTFASQSEFLVKLLAVVCKQTKKPVVIVTTKNDEAEKIDELNKELSKLLSRKELKQYNLQTVHTSAHRCVNVDVAFALLGHSIERLKSRPKVSAYAIAARQRDEIERSALSGYSRSLGRLLPPNSDDTPAVEIDFSLFVRQTGLTADIDFCRYCDAAGWRAAQSIYRDHLRSIRQQRMRRQLAQRAQRLPEVMSRLFPTLECVPSTEWRRVVQWLQMQADFERHFIPVGTCSGTSVVLPDESVDARLPAELLFWSEAQTTFERHLDALENAQQHARLRTELEYLLSRCAQVTPGKALDDVRLFLMGEPAFEAVPDELLRQIYDEYQSILISHAGADLVELLLEQTAEFTARVYGPRMPNKGSIRDSTAVLCQADMKQIHEKLREDARYRKMTALFDERDNLIHQYASFVACPLRRHCPAGDSCTDGLVENVLCQLERRTDKSMIVNASPTSTLPPVSLPQSVVSLDVTVLSVDCAADWLVQELRPHMPAGLHTFVQNGAETKCRLAMRCVDPAHLDQSGDALVAVFATRAGATAIRQRLLGAADGKEGAVGAPFCADKVLLVTVACDPAHLDDLPFLQQQGADLASKLCCPFITVGRHSPPPPAPMPGGHMRRGAYRPRGPPVPPRAFSPHANDATASNAPKCFGADQLQRVLHTICSVCLAHRQHQRSVEPSGDVRPLRLLICCACSDSDGSSGEVDALLAPFVAACTGQFGYVKLAPDEVLPPALLGHNKRATYNTLHCGLTTSSAPVSVTISSYHGALALLGRLLPGGTKLATSADDAFQFDGVAVVYSVKRLAGLKLAENLLEMMDTLKRGVPCGVFALGETTEYFDSATGAAEGQPGTGWMLDAGDNLARKFGGKLTSVSNALPQTADLYAALLHSMAEFNRKSEQNEGDCAATPEEGIYESLSDYHAGTPPDEAASVAQSSGDKQAAGSQRCFSTDFMASSKRLVLGPATSEAGTVGSSPNTSAAPSRSKSTNTPPLNAAALCNSARLQMSRQTVLGSDSAGTSSPFSLVGGSSKKRSCSTKTSVSGGLAAVMHPSVFGLPGIPMQDWQGLALRRELLLKSASARADHLVLTGRAHPLADGRHAANPLHRAASLEALSSPDDVGNGAKSRGRQQRQQLPQRSRRAARFHSTAAAGGHKRSVPELELRANERRRGAVLVLPHRGRPTGNFNALDAARDRLCDGVSTSAPSCSSSNARTSSTGSSWFKQRRHPQQQGAEAGPPPRSAPTKSLSPVIPNGATLRSLAASQDDPVPAFVRKCVEFIESEGGLESEGLYRVPGNQAQVSYLENKFVDDSSVDFRTLDVPVNAVATALKNFFSSLPEPAIPAVLYADLIDAVAGVQRQRQSDGAARTASHVNNCSPAVGSPSAEDSAAERCRCVLVDLPDENRALLLYFTAHLARVARASQRTSMDERNLAKCWWPTLLRPDFRTFEEMAQWTPRLEEFALLLLSRPDVVLAVDAAL